MTDAEFLASDFFDARDAVQVKYEMVRKVQAGGAAVTEAAAAFGYSRPAYYAAAAALDDVAESTGAAGLHSERAERYRQDRQGWRARLRQYQGARQVPASARDDWWPLDDEDEWAAMLLSRWPVLPDDFVRGPPPAASRRKPA